MVLLYIYECWIRDKSGFERAGWGVGFFYVKWREFIKIIGTVTFFHIPFSTSKHQLQDSGSHKSPSHEYQNPKKPEQVPEN
jgi:hypothetical protein